MNLIEKFIWLIGNFYAGIEIKTWDQGSHIILNVNKEIKKSPLKQG
jgi:hypothetical protein